LQLRIATFNVENLFSRPKALNQPTWQAGQPAVDAAGELNALFNKDVYTPADQKRMLKLLGDQGLLAGRPNGPYLRLVKVRGRLFSLAGGTPSIVATGRDAWIGWVAHKPDRISDAAIENTARVIAEVDPDVLVCVEVEDRPTLERFHDGVLAPLLAAQGKAPLPYAMVIDGNDDRGIDVGILSRYPIDRMRSHVADRTAAGKPTFSRDCPEYYVRLPNGKELVVLPNHFASKGSDLKGDRRKVQAAAVAGIVKAVRATHELVVVAGDLNDHPAGGSLGALLTGTDLVDAMALPVYTGLPGTYEHARAEQKLDYLLLSPKLRGQVAAVDVCRKGFYAPTKWASFPGVDATGRTEASDHHCLWAEVGV